MQKGFQNKTAGIDKNTGFAVVAGLLLNITGELHTGVEIEFTINDFTYSMEQTKLSEIELLNSGAWLGFGFDPNKKPHKTFNNEGAHAWTNCIDSAPNAWKWQNARFSSNQYQRVCVAAGCFPVDEFSIDAGVLSKPVEYEYLHQLLFVDQMMTPDKAAEYKQWLYDMINEDFRRDLLARINENRRIVADRETAENEIIRLGGLVSHYERTTQQIGSEILKDADTLTKHLTEVRRSLKRACRMPTAWLAFRNDVDGLFGKVIDNELPKFTALLYS